MFSSGRRQRPNIACIFVHAGAGFHSSVNEEIHMRACNDAALSAMAVMKAGGSAIDAVELAIKVLEDREITNAGYGSNLTIDGIVECDAVVVDRLGRSGAVGAVAQIKNPISLARLVLDRTTQTLSLRRVPPNLLVGRGAADFAYENGMSILPFDFLISPVAKVRWQSWQADLRRAHEKSSGHSYAPIVVPSMDPAGYPYPERDSESSRRSHVRSMLDSVWNEAQPISPPPSDNKDPGPISPWLSCPQPSPGSVGVSSQGTDNDPGIGVDQYGPEFMVYGDYYPAVGNAHTGANAFMNYQYSPSSTDLSGAYIPYNNADVSEFINLESCSEELRQSGVETSSTPISYDGLPTSGSRNDSETTQDTLSDSVQESIATITPTGDEHPSETAPSQTLPTSEHAHESDRITDTVGAIAIDLLGNIACGASSGGIGMKHRGRVGPAALIGAGAAVIPVEPDDGEEVTVATVTSGTGEHIGTTTAAKTCSERVYEGRRKVGGGRFEECADDEAVIGFVQSEFLKHPSVTNSNSKGEIGILTVKKSKQGIYFYYAHTTQSFAIASLRSDETKPSSTMSRNRGSAIAQGGRAIRLR